jgi:hypothetical protein
MKLTGIHFLLTYQCTSECDHCFVWGSPRHKGAFTSDKISAILMQARKMDGLKNVAFEGGEPFIYYNTLLAGVEEAVKLGFSVAIVTNCYWASNEGAAYRKLSPFQGLLSGLTISSDLFHSHQETSPQVQAAQSAADELGIPTSTICVPQPPASGVMYRGRAAQRLAGTVAHYPQEQFDCCPHENLADPGRVHVDPMGFMHICQGITLGNCFSTSLEEICLRYDPASHPVTAPLLAGGPAELARKYHLEYAQGFADACHLCFQARLDLRPRFPDILTPDAMYGLI